MLDYVERGTECGSKREFAQLLQRCLESNSETVSGETSSCGGRVPRPVRPAAQVGRPRRDRDEPRLVDPQMVDPADRRRS